MIYWTHKSQVINLLVPLGLLAYLAVNVIVPLGMLAFLAVNVLIQLETMFVSLTLKHLEMHRTTNQILSFIKEHGERIWERNKSTSTITHKDLSSPSKNFRVETNQTLAFIYKDGEINFFGCQYSCTVRNHGFFSQSQASKNVSNK